MSDRRIVVVRHGVTDWNREGRFQGHLDPPLSDVGGREAAMLGARIAADDGLRPARIVSSSLARASETAAAIGEACGVAVELDPRLIEIGQGEWEGRTHAELEVSDADRYRAWRDAAGIRQPPGGEPISAANARVAALLDELLAAPAGTTCVVSHGGTLRIFAPAGTTCVVSHGGTLRIFARLVLELADDRSWALDVDNASLGAVDRHGDEWRLVRWNDTSHLLGIEPTHVDEAEGRPLAL